MAQKNFHILSSKFEQFIIASNEDLLIRNLALRIYNSASEVKEPQRTYILERLPRTIFISHTSLDDKFIKGSNQNDKFPKQESIWGISGERFYDPFYHSLKTGEADAYEAIVGLSLLATKRVLIIWSENASRSNYVRAELLIAIAAAKKIVVYKMPNAPNFPFEAMPMVYDLQSLRLFLNAW